MQTDYIPTILITLIVIYNLYNYGKSIKKSGNDKSSKMWFLFLTGVVRGLFYIWVYYMLCKNNLSYVAWLLLLVKFSLNILTTLVISSTPKKKKVPIERVVGSAFSAVMA